MQYTARILIQDQLHLFLAKLHGLKQLQQGKVCIIRAEQDLAGMFLKEYPGLIAVPVQGIKSAGARNITIQVVVGFQQFVDGAKFPYPAFLVNVPGVQLHSDVVPEIGSVRDEADSRKFTEPLLQAGKVMEDAGKGHSPLPDLLLK